jgi:hypothetical protein
MNSTNRTRLYVYLVPIAWNICLVSLYLAKPLRWYYFLPLTICSFNLLGLFINFKDARKNSSWLDIKLADFNIVKVSALLFFFAMSVSFFTFPPYEFEGHSREFVLIVLTFFFISTFLFSIASFISEVGAIYLKEKNQE